MIWILPRPFSTTSESPETAAAAAPVLGAVAVAEMSLRCIVRFGVGVGVDYQKRCFTLPEDCFGANRRATRELLGIGIASAIDCASEPLRI